MLGMAHSANNLATEHLIRTANDLLCRVVRRHHEGPLHRQAVMWFNGMHIDALLLAPIRKVQPSLQQFSQNS